MSNYKKMQKKNWFFWPVKVARLLTPHITVKICDSRSRSKRCERTKWRRGKAATIIV